MRCVNRSVWSVWRTSGGARVLPGRRALRAAFVLWAAFTLAPDARAQTIPDTPLARFITDLVASGARIDARASNERPDFIVPAELGGITAQLNQTLSLQLATFPIDMGVAAAKPGSDSLPTQHGFSPAFSLHAGSLGRRKLSVSFNYQNTSFGSLDGIGLDSGQIGFVLTPPPAVQSQFGRNVVHETLSLRIQQDVATFGVVYGAADRLDIGIGIPIVHLQAEGLIRSQVFRTPGPSTSDRYFFDVYPASPVQREEGCSGSSVDITGVPRAPGDVAKFDMVELLSRAIVRRCAASGIGDLAVHARYRFLDSRANAFAATITARLPTGNADQLLGSGGTRTTAALVWSGRSGRFLPHANVGYTFSSGHASPLLNTVADGVLSPTPIDLTIPNEINIAAGTDLVFFGRLTVGADAFVRRIKDLSTFRVNDSTAPALAPGDAQVPGTLLQANGKGATLAVGIAAAQVALTDRTFLKTDVMFPLFGDGLRPRIGFGAGLGIRY